MIEDKFILARATTENFAYPSASGQKIVAIATKDMVVTPSPIQMIVAIVAP